MYLPAQVISALRRATLQADGWQEEGDGEGKGEGQAESSSLDRLSPSTFTKSPRSVSLYVYMTYSVCYSTLRCILLNIGHI